MKELVTIKVANLIYDVLVQDGGAVESMRDNFVYAASETGITEYRFQGKLGYGGKFWINSGRWYVNCYREDENNSRQDIIDKINRQLTTMKLMWDSLNE